MIRRAPLAAALAAVLVLGLAAAASAHVTVDPGSAPKGGTDQELTFRVPNEEASAATVGLDMQIPTDHPLLGVDAEAMPGWKVSVKTTKLAKPVKTDDGTITEAVSEITWTGGTIAPGSYADFRIIVGQLPSDTDQLKFPAIQTYRGAPAVSWIEDPAAPGQPEPEHPAPILTLTKGGTAGAAPVTTAPTVSASPVTRSDVDAAGTKGLIGIVLGAVGLLLGGASLLVVRRNARG